MANDHFVPQLYLRYFIPEGGKALWVYDKVTGDITPRPTSKTLTRKGFYDFQEGLEQDFDKKQENYIKPILERWHLPEAIPEPREIEKFASFLAFLHTRGPKAAKTGQTIIASVDISETLAWAQDPEAVKNDWEQRVKNADVQALMASPKVREMMEQVVQKTTTDYWRQIKAAGLDNQISFEEVQGLADAEMRRREQQVLNGETPLSQFVPLEIFQQRAKEAVHTLQEIKTLPPESVALSQMLANAEVITPYLLERTWCLCTAPAHTFFITNDCPVIAFNRESDQSFSFGGFRRKEADIVFPLSLRLCLLLSYTRTQKRCRVSERFVKKVNKILVGTAERFVISPYRTKHLDRLIAQTKKQSFQTSREKQRKSTVKLKDPKEIKDRVVKELIQTVQ